MNRKDLYQSMNQIDDDILERSEVQKKKTTSVWLKWGAMAVCLCLVVSLVIPIVVNTIKPKDDSAGTLMGDTEIYPTVMVDGQLYEWRKGAAICEGLPNDSVYYGELTHIDGQNPTRDGEFVSIFSVSGQIYTISENDACVYLCLTTDWLNETVVVFDLVTNCAPAE